MVHLKECPIMLKFTIINEGKFQMYMLTSEVI